MKRILPILLTVGLIVGGLAFNSSANLINGSFESSTFSGWQLSISSGQSAAQRGYRPAGAASVVPAWGQTTELSPIRTARDGNRFAMLETLAQGNFIGHRSYYITLQQRLVLTAGTTLSGWASFYNGDTDGHDSAWVKILNAAGNTIATPWSEYSGCGPTLDFDGVGHREASPWTPWSWQTPEAGSYTLSFGMTTTDDNNLASYGFFDGLLVSPAALPVPEPSALALVTLGTVVLLYQRRTTARQTQN